MRLLKFLLLILMFCAGLLPAAADGKKPPVRVALILQADPEYEGQARLLLGQLAPSLDLLPELRVLDVRELDRRLPGWPTQAQDLPRWARELGCGIVYLIRLNPHPDGWLASLEHYDAADGRSSAEFSLGPLPAERLAPALYKTLLTRFKLSQTPARQQIVDKLLAYQAESQSLRASAHLAMVRGEFTQALAELDQAMGLEPANPGLYLERAHARGELQDMNGAIADVNAALKLSPAWPDALYQRGLAWGLLREYDRVVQDLEAAYRVDPWYRPELPLLLGQHARDSGGMKRAQAYFEQAVAIDPEFAAGLQALGHWWLLQNAPARALPFFERGFKANPDPDIRYDLLTARSIALTSLKRNPESITDLTAAINLAPDKPLAWYLRGLSWAIGGQCPKARYDWNKACGMGMAEACLQTCR
ncbi:MAG: tetratricopeptide repeat protein [Candidatus Sericytochromatia bacterium]